MSIIPHSADEVMAPVKGFGAISPGKAPYWLVSVGCVAAMVYVCYQVDPSTWVWVFLPLYCASLLSIVLSFRKLRDFGFTDSTYREQLRIARAIGISWGAIMLALGTVDLSASDPIFAWIWLLCVAQMAVFFLHARLSFKYWRPKRELNYVQLTLITTTMLTATVYAINGAHSSWRHNQLQSISSSNLGKNLMAQLFTFRFWNFSIPSYAYPVGNGETPKTIAYLRTAVSLGLLHISCLLIWTKLLFGYQRDPPQRNRRKSDVPAPGRVAGNVGASRSVLIQR